jgi:predicted enzyme related to lactoylglutathione lyase
MKETPMPIRDSAPVGAPTWNDLFTSDPDAAATFYTSLFGWKVDDPGPEFGGYKNFTKDGIPVAGFMKNDGQWGAPDAWSIYLRVNDAAATVDAAVAAGGEIVYPAMDVATLGSQAMVSDPGGAAIGIWQPKDVQGFGVLAEPNTPAWFELHTRDYEGALAFYADVFGWDVHTAADEPGFRYSTNGVEEKAVAGVMDAGAFLPEGVPSHWSVYFQTEDADAYVAKAVELGGSIVVEAMDSPYGRLVTLADSTGAIFKLQQP